MPAVNVEETCLPRGIEEIDCSKRRISYRDPQGRRVDVEFREKTGVDMFLVACSVAIVQDGVMQARQVDNWRGVSNSFLRRLSAEFGWNAKPSSLRTYWSACCAGSRAKQKLTRVFTTIEGERKEFGVAWELFKWADGPVLGPGREAKDGTQPLWSIRFVPCRSQEDADNFERLRATVLSLAEEPGKVADSPHHAAVAGKKRTAEAIENLRRRLREEAERALKNALRSDTTAAYVELQLSVGHFPTREEREAAGDAIGQKPLEMGRVWGPCSISLLKPPRENYFLSSVSGAGKSTFLRHLQCKMLKPDGVLPIYVEARDLIRKRRVTWPFVRRVILEDLALTTKATRRALDRAHRDGNVVLLVDALDNLGEIGMNCSELVEEITSSSVGCPVVMAGRPSAARWVEDRHGIVLLRLEQFDDLACRTFFGDSYGRAKEICRDSWELMGTPMLAYMVRKLIRIGEDKDIRNRCGLYERFVHHVLYDHPANWHLEDHDEWAHDVFDGLAMVSYRAIDRQVHLLEVIPSAVVRKIVGRKRKNLGLGLLRSAGLADVLAISRNPRGPALVFTHKSFQEYLAAEWASESEEQKSHVIDEYWNPKWKEVIKFLAGKAGKEGEELIRRLYPGPEHDNVIHSRLFFAAECVGEMGIETHVSDKVISHLSKLTDCSPFESDAASALVLTGVPSALDRAWQCLQATRNVGLPDHLLQRLFAPDRLAWVQTQLLPASNRDDALSGCLQMCLHAWSRALSDSYVDKLVHLALSEDPEESRAVIGLMRALISRIRRHHIEALLAKLRQLEEETQKAGRVDRQQRKVPEYVVCALTGMAGALDREQRLWLTDFACTCSAALGEDIICVLKMHSALYQPCEVDALLDMYVAEQRQRLFDLLGSVARRFTAEQVRRVAGCIETSGMEDSAIELLDLSEQLVDPECFCRIKPRLAKWEISPRALSLLARHHSYLSSGERRAILAKVRDRGTAWADKTDRMEAYDYALLRAVGFLAPYAERADVNALVRWHQRAENKGPVLNACSFVLNKMTKKQVHALLRTPLDTWQKAGGPGADISGLVSYVEEADRRWALRRLESGGIREGDVSFYLPWFWRGALRDEEIRVFTKMRDDGFYGSLVYQALKEWHEKGRL